MPPNGLFNRLLLVSKFSKARLKRDCECETNYEWPAQAELVKQSPERIEGDSARTRPNDTDHQYSDCESVTQRSLLLKPQPIEPTVVAF